MKYAYIMGRGHSGTTVLDALLGHTPHVESVGEIVSGMARLDAPCSCDSAMRECRYWTAVRNRFESGSGYTWRYAANRIKAQAHVGSFFVTMFKRRKGMRELIDITAHLADSILDTSGKLIVLDSSKTPARALFLVRHFPNSRVIHLVRDPAAILASNYWRIQSGRGFKFLRRTYRQTWFTPVYLMISALSWVLGNLLAELVKLVEPSQVMLIRYEDIGADAERQFNRLSGFLNADVTQAAKAISAGTAIPFGHNIGGNQVRRLRTFVFEPKARDDHPLPPLYRVMTRIICWPLMLRYGYKLVGSEAR